MPSKFELTPEYVVKDEHDLRSSFAATHDIAIKKCLDRLD